MADIDSERVDSLVDELLEGRPPGETDDEERRWRRSRLKTASNDSTNSARSSGRARAMRS
jgi:hypothetical protein